MAGVFQREPPSKKTKSNTSAPKKQDDEEPSWQLENKRYVKVREFRGRVFVDIREYYEADGELKPGKKGEPRSNWEALQCSRVLLQSREFFLSQYHNFASTLSSRKEGSEDAVLVARQLALSSPAERKEIRSCWWYKCIGQRQVKQAETYRPPTDNPTSGMERSHISEVLVSGNVREFL
ncbi:hypothetical protein PR048_025791 [Dryococelus australis]|uniref:Transcriptional coactivator p15 (PC4) C-terminal domain-containing protein n=1 Tax=Dryococelus australis TaxID=614101 RepID=A0ABQ9GJJ4_9NEOP|nr:hypothetical protein PR048_025791 [Dryococelus australis]